MIKLFISDIDGCLAEPYRPYDWARFQTLRERVAAAGPVGASRVQPAFSLCSGRAYPYVEAMTQALGVRAPVLFESGGGLFDPEAAQVTWHPAFTPEIEEQLQAVREWMLRACLPGTSLMYDYGKRTQAGVIGPDADEVAAAVPRVEAFVAKHLPDLRVFFTPVSIDVLAPHLTKKQALAWLAGRLDLTLDELAYIGDSNGDIEALESAGASFAPANAAEAVKRCVQQVTPSPLIEGVLEAYRWCVLRNQERHDGKMSSAA